MCFRIFLLSESVNYAIPSQWLYFVCGLIQRRIYWAFTIVRCSTFPLFYQFLQHFPSSPNCFSREKKLRKNLEYCPLYPSNQSMVVVAFFEWMKFETFFYCSDLERIPPGSEFLKKNCSYHPFQWSYHSIISCNLFSNIFHFQKLSLKQVVQMVASLFGLCVVKYVFGKCVFMWCWFGMVYAQL